MWNDNINSLYDDITLSCQLLTSTVQMMMCPPADWPFLTATLTMNIFQTLNLFDESFAPLESLRRALHDHAIFTEFL
jgi:hypothetical protein